MPDPDSQQSSRRREQRPPLTASAAAVARELSASWKNLRLVERRRLSGARARLMSLLAGPEDGYREALEQFRQSLARAEKHSLVRHAAKIRCEFPDDLPITARIPAIRAALGEHSVVIVCGSTGSGKTTQLPKAALLEGFGRTGRIGCTQPRRIAASALAQRLASETGVECGREIGYKLRFDDRTGDETVIKFMTDGILLAETRSDPDLLQYDCLILDEVHERSLNIDFLLGYVKLLLARRRNLKVVISSATLEANRLSDFFGGAPVIEVEGRLFPVEDCFLEPEEDEELSESVARGVEFLGELDPRGDILVFLPGEREIRDAAEILEGRRYPATEILPLFGRLSAGDQGRIFQRSQRRRVILSTNVAETSLTIPGIRFVLDSGLVRLSRYNPRSRIQELRVERISRASAMQRRGRCGRLRDGVCLHLYSEQEYADAVPYTDPEIQRSSLAGVILQMASLGLPRIDVFPFVDPPGDPLIREGLRTLTDLQAISPNGALTPTGKRLAEFPLDPHLARILLAGAQYRVLPEATVVTAFLSIQDPRERPFESAKEADAAQKKFQSDTSDFLSVLNLWTAVGENLAVSLSALRKFARKTYLNFRRLREWRNLVADLLEDQDTSLTLNSLKIDPAKVPYDALHKSLMHGLPRQLANYDPEAGVYSDMNGRKFTIFPGSGLASRRKSPAWIMSFVLMETSRVYARCVAEIRPEWLEEVAPHLCHKNYDRIAWDETAGFVYARERVTAGQLLIHPGRRCHYGRIDAAKARGVFLKEGLVPGRIPLTGTWAAAYVRRLSALRSLELKMRRPESLVNDAALLDHFETVIPPGMNSCEEIKRDWQRTHRDYTPAPAIFLYDEEADLPEDDFPDSLVSGGLRLDVSYSYDPGEPNDGVTLTLPAAQLNLISRHCPDYLVPGYLAWKVDFLLRNLPKSIRREIMPLGDCMADFMTAYRDHELFTEQPLSRCLAEFLLEHRGVEVDENLFESADLPEYLRMKLALCDADGKLMEVRRDIPLEDSQSVRVSPILSAAKRWTFPPLPDAAWPVPGDLPLSVSLTVDSDKQGYPGLTDEGAAGAGCALFLSEPEALLSHERGVLRLCRLRLAGIVKQWKNLIKVSNAVKLTFFLDYRDWQNDLLNAAVRDALGCPSAELRSEARFEDALERCRASAGEKLADRLRLLESYAVDYAAAASRMKSLDSGSEPRCDAEAQLAFLFRDGFLRTPDAVQGYSRFLKALAVRMERARMAYAKDAVKGAWVTPYIRKFQVALNAGKAPEDTPALMEFFLLLEEARIAAWSPERPTLFKVSPAVLERNWNRLAPYMI